MWLAELVRRPAQESEPAPGPGGRRRRPAAAAAVDPVAAGDALESLEKGLVATVIVQGEKTPADRDRKPGDRPERIARSHRQAAAQREPE